MELIAADVGNMYLEAYTTEKICFIEGREFKVYGHEGQMMLIDKVFYGLKTSGARCYDKFIKTMNQLGFVL